MKYPYKFSEGEYLPIVPLEIGNFIFEAYVDSGASYTMLHADVASLLKINIEEGKETFVTVGDGSQITVYIHKLKVKFAGKEFKAIIGFSKNLGIGFNIIGMKDFFDHFKVIFNNKERILEIVEHRTSIENKF